MESHTINPKSLEALAFFASKGNIEISDKIIIKKDLLGSCKDLVDIGFLRKEWIKSTDEDVYSITKKGIRYFNELLENARKIVDQDIYKRP